MKGNGQAVSHDSEPATELRAVTPNDSTDLGIQGIDTLGTPFRYPRALKIGTAGNINVLAADDTSPVVMAVNAGEVLPVSAKRVYSTSTTATGIVALY